MACDLVSIPITIVAFESAFSIGRRIIDKYQSLILSENAERSYVCEIGFMAIKVKF